MSVIFPFPDQLRIVISIQFPIHPSINRFKVPSTARLRETRFNQTLHTFITPLRTEDDCKTHYADKVLC